MILALDYLVHALRVSKLPKSNISFERFWCPPLLVCCVIKVNAPIKLCHQVTARMRWSSNLPGKLMNAHMHLALQAWYFFPVSLLLCTAAGAASFETDAATQQDLALRHNLQQGLVLTVRPQHIMLSLEQIRNLPWEETVAIWQDYVNALAACLVSLFHASHR